MLDTEGRRRLVWLLEDPENDFTQAKIAAGLGIKPPSVSAWVSGHARPKTHQRIALCRLVGDRVVGGIPEESWMTEGERAIAFGAPEVAPSPENFPAASGDR